MLNFTRKSAKRFSLKWKDLPEKNGDRWKIDVVMLGRTPMLFIVHEPTLFTMVRRKSEFKTPVQIAEEIRRCCSWYKGGDETDFGKSNNRRVTGSITEMKQIVHIMDYSPVQINAMEMQLNGIIYNYLHSQYGRAYSKPFDAVTGYCRGELS